MEEFWDGSEEVEEIRLSLSNQLIFEVGKVRGLGLFTSGVIAAGYSPPKAPRIVVPSPPLINIAVMKICPITLVFFPAAARSDFPNPFAAALPGTPL